LRIEPTPARSLLAVLATLKPIDQDFAQIADLPIDDVDL
jgi:hypothetical protein